MVPIYILYICIPITYCVFVCIYHIFRHALILFLTPLYHLPRDLDV